MITQTPRTDPMASATPSSSRYTPHQPRTPITPNRYRAHPSLNQAFPSTPSSRRSSVAESADNSPPAKSSASNWQASIELSLTTRRRLIRKPLPQLPSSQIHDHSSAEDADSGLIDSSALDAQYSQADSWWPEALPEKQTSPASSAAGPSNAGPSGASSSRFSTRTQSETAPSSNANDGQGLDEQSLRHLLTILHYAALRYESSADPIDGDGTIGRNVVVSSNGTYKKQSTSKDAAASATGDADSLYVLDEAVLESLYLALQAAFRHLSQKQVLGALQRTASIRWRAEAQLRNATAAQAAETNQALSSRWARFAWPAAALGKAYKEAQKNILPLGSVDDTASAFSTASQLRMNRDLFAAGINPDTDHRIRKRDVAVKILSNAIWFVRNYGPDAGVEHLDADNDEKHASCEAKASPPRSDGLPPQSIRRTSENLLKKHAGLPNFVAKSSATTAVSGTATPESSQSVPPSAARTAPLTPIPVQNTGNIPSSTSNPQFSEAVSEKLRRSAEYLAESSAELSGGIGSTTPGPSSNSTAGEKSKAVEHLASLSAAAGAAMKQKAQQAAAAAAAGGGTPALSIDAAISGTLHPRSSRPNLRSFVSQSAAEAAETDALEKAEREYLAEIGQGCDEWAKMVVCRLCASFQVANSTDKGNHRRSGTLTARDFGKASAGASADTDVGSSISTRSDMTAKAVKIESTHAQRDGQAGADTSSHGQSGEAVAWVADVFEGQELFAHHGSSSHERKASVSKHDEEERVRVVGGSFICRVDTDEQRQALIELIEIALYVGMSMLLESSFLSDSDAARPKMVKVPARTTSTVDAPARGASLAQQPVISRATSQTSLDGSQRSVSGGSSSTHTLIRPGSAADGGAEMHEAENAQNKSGHRKWGKSLWGMIGQPHGSTESGANQSSVRPGTSDGHAAPAPRASLTMNRYHTGDDTNSLSATRKALFKAGEEPKNSIAARKAALFANVSNISAPPTPHASRADGPPTGKPNRLVGRLMNAFARPSSSDQSPADLRPGAASAPPNIYGRDTSVGDQVQALESVGALTRRSRVSSGTQLSHHQRPRAQAKPAPIFPLQNPSPAALSASPELSMLLCYQYQADSKLPGFPTEAYLIAFHRLQALRFLADQQREHMTFGAPSHGIPSSGDLLPFAGVQKPVSSAWSVISSRLQQQQSQERPHATSVQLLSYELLSGDGSARGLCREEVAFYQRLSNSRDVPLGQVIEELGLRACALEADRDLASASTDSRIVSSKINVTGNKDGNEASRLNSAYGVPEQRLQFIHGSFRIKVVATVLPSRLYEIEAETKRDASSEAETASTNSMAQAGSTAASPSLLPTKSRESDVSAIAAASHTDKDAANTAFAVAETAVQAAESGTSRPLVDQKASGSTSGIWMWNASAKSGWQGKAAPMSESTYLLSFARYLEAISYHPALRRAAGLEPSNTKAYGGLSNVQQQLRQGRSEDARSVAEGPNLLRFFRSGRSLVKVQVQPLVLYDLQIEGPCLKTGSERRRERKQKQAQADKRRFKQLVEELRLEIQRFFASIKRNTTKLEDVFVSRELGEAGRTIRKKPAQLEKGELASSASDSTVSDQVAEPLNLLTNLRSALRSDEFELYEALQRTYCK